MSYIGINDRFSYKFDTFTYNSSPLIKLTLRNSTIKLYMNIDPAIIDPKYFVKNVSDLKIYEQTPSLLKVASKRGVKYAIELIDMLMLNFSISPKSKFSPLHFSQLLYGVSPYETALSRLKKVLKKSASAEDAWTLDDDSAEDLILIKSGFDADAYNGAKTVELGISELGEKFNDNDIVDFESLANKGLLNINEKCLIRIVAGNKVLDKSLTVIANEFTMDAAKLILITGGKAVVIK